MSNNIFGTIIIPKPILCTHKWKKRQRHGFDL